MIIPLVTSASTGFGSTTRADSKIREAAPVERIARRYGDSSDSEAHLLDDVGLTGAALTATNRVLISSRKGCKRENGTIRAMHASRTIFAGVIACFLFRPVVAIVGGQD